MGVSRTARGTLPLVLFLTSLISASLATDFLTEITPPAVAPKPNVIYLGFPAPVTGAWPGGAWMKVGGRMAIDHIERYGSDHTEAIVSENYTTVQRFLDEVQSSVVIANASTRFSDGGQMGLGAEIGISTTKLHAYGPMGVTDLTARKYVIRGTGQIRS